MEATEGTGLLNVKAVADKYGGDFAVSCDAEKFQAVVMLCLSSSDMAGLSRFVMMLSQFGFVKLMSTGLNRSAKFQMNAACMFWDNNGNKTLSYNPESRNWKAISTEEEFARARVFTSIYNDEFCVSYLQNLLHLKPKFP
mgnify:CR=1 FL=1